MKILVDVDGTICTNTNGDYINAEPIRHRINYFNTLYELGHEIHYWTARGGNSGKDWSELTKKQFIEWEVKHTTLKFNKPVYDLWIDDKAHNVEDFFNNETFSNR